MPLIRCRRCARLFDSLHAIREICHDCRMILEGTYNRVHKYIKNHEPDKEFNAERLAYELEEDIDTIKFLIEDGWLERDMQTYSRVTSKRQKLAGEFEHELDQMKTGKKISTYGGKIYRRKK